MRTNLFSFSGTINRASFWLALLIAIVVWVVGILVGMSFRGGLGDTIGLPITITIILLVTGFSGWIAVAAGVKRLRDRGKSGWWLLLFYAVPTIIYCNGPIIFVELTPIAFVLATFVLPPVGFGTFAWALIELGCLKGTNGANASGTEPLPSSQGSTARAA
jgi:uncharacterized membrane protein YhaH (DUF805 family)